MHWSVARKNMIRSQMLFGMPTGHTRIWIPNDNCVSQNKNITMLANQPGEDMPEQFFNSGIGMSPWALCALITPRARILLVTYCLFNSSIQLTTIDHLMGHISFVSLLKVNCAAAKEKLYRPEQCDAIFGILVDSVSRSHRDSLV